jgi:hypothetical protein
VIVADGTEMKQIERLAMCGDMEAFVSALATVAKHLGRKWDEVLGTDNKQLCSIRINVNQAGQILGREVLSCEDVAALDKVLAAADPVPAPKDACLLASLNAIKFEINSDKKE